MSDVILITGASSGIGFETAKKLAEQGHKVYAAARRMDKLELLKPYGVIPIALDITNNDSIKNAVHIIIEKEGKVDVLINNAGYGSLGALEDVPMQEAKEQFEVNVFGLARLTQLLLPFMRNQHYGRIINVSSVVGRLTTSFGAWYSASKYSVEALSDALRMETKDYGIKVSIIEPGGIKTNWGFIAAEHLEESAKGGAYESRATNQAEGMRKLYGSKMLSNPKVISKAISHAVNSKHPKTRYLVGRGAKTMVAAKTILPTKVMDKILTSF